MDKKKKLEFIGKNTDQYLQIQKRTLESRLDKIDLSKDKHAEIIKGETLKNVRDKGLSLLGPMGDVINTVITWNDDINQNINEAKKMILLEQYFTQSDEHSIAIQQLQSFITNPQGNTLFNKILRIVDDSPPDPELTYHLSNVLKKIIEDGNFEELFEKHKYALGQIERLTPQAITIIADYSNWPPIRLTTSIAFGPKVTSDFYMEFTTAYSQSKSITDTNKIKRIQHSVVEIQNLGLMYAYRAENDMTKCQLTDIGQELLNYIN
ncbi:hypothetical protein [Jeotgalibacillus proteolyticus]|uniref:DUF4393 domain-containing protein n=1 Tax=Jeotgalibacillus proteolyticus TaxID=2082395 RepID=A0A2S5G683_9BACL|nr:hypothetical protein [Jeotgalibacillus proteolyticus]PPA68434.1 hypothetical protein C4B60_20940 [Jeotgalibacillus proteolyticus]